MDKELLLLLLTLTAFCVETDFHFHFFTYRLSWQKVKKKNLRQKTVQILELHLKPMLLIQVSGLCRAQLMNQAKKNLKIRLNNCPSLILRIFYLMLKGLKFVKPWQLPYRNSFLITDKEVLKALKSCFSALDQVRLEACQKLHWPLVLSQSCPHEAAPTSCLQWNSYLPPLCEDSSLFI